MPIAHKARLGLKERIHSLRQAASFDRYIKQLVSIYTSPYLKPKYDYTEYLAAREKQAIDALDKRFASDRLIILRALLSAFAPEHGHGQTKELPGAFKDYCSGGIPQTPLHESVVSAISMLCEHPLNQTNSLPLRVQAILSADVETITSKPSKYGAAGYLPASQQAALVCAILDQVIEEILVPRMFEYDHLDDLVAIVESRYAGPIEKHKQRSAAVLGAIKCLAACDQSANAKQLAGKLRNLLGDNHPYQPKRGPAHQDIKKIVPELYDELVSIKASENLERFKEINREYSYRQRLIHQEKGNPWGQPLLAGLEQDHHLMLRTLLSLRKQGKLTADDQVLVVGPRYVDELDFFRKYLGMPKTIGLDLFENAKDGIVAGDMHATDFKTGQFGLIYCTGTLNYAYDLRKVGEEFARILKRPGFLCLMDAGNRVFGVDPLGRSDPMSVDALLSCFYQHKTIVHARDNGRTPLPSMFHGWPCMIVELT